MKKFKAPFFSIALLAALLLCSSWGFLMHRTITQLAVYPLPPQMQSFFYHFKDEIVKNSTRPDERRRNDPSEDAKHFIDFDAYGPKASRRMPMDWDIAVLAFSKDTLLKYGYVPYWVMVMQERLTNAFRQRRRDSILFYATDLAHYIADAHVPLHTSVNYDGQLTGQKGLHALWESTVPELTIEQLNLAGAKKARYLQQPQEAIWSALRHAHQLVPEVLRAETEASKAFPEAIKYRVQMRQGRAAKSYSTDFARAYAQRILPSLNDQALRAARLIADFWYTAWVDAGRPVLDNLIVEGFPDYAEQALKEEVKAYQNNALFTKGWLLAKKLGASFAE